MSDGRMLLAMHEAGHVVVGRLYGFRVERAQIMPALPGDGLHAFTRWTDKDMQRRQRLPSADLVVTVAGPLAEALYAQKNFRDVLEEGAQYPASDVNFARRTASKLARMRIYKSADAALVAAESLARNILTQHWADVAITAMLLYVNGHVDY